MVSTKQFTIFFLLVVVFLVAIMIVTSLAWREASTTYDTSAIKGSLLRIVDVSSTKIRAQEIAMNGWVTEVNHEMLGVEHEIDGFQEYVHAKIY